LTRQSLYLLRGERKADKITLHELAALQRPDPCADPKVRLDIYRGTVRGDVLNLSWGEGSQTLRRAAARPSLAMPLQWGLKN
jgi:hypothetical protein